MRVLDLFSGIGGFSLGLERAGMMTVAFCEVDPFCQQVLRKRWPTVPIYNDVRDLSSQHLTGDKIGTVDLICGGFPCQDISHASAGRRLGLDGAKSGMWHHMRRLIDEIRPGWVVIENSYRGRRKWLDDVAETLVGYGYTVAAVEIAAHDLGACHERQRCFVLADASGGRCWAAAEAIRARWESVKLHPQWSRQPGLHRVDDGFSGRVDRLRKRALGNAVVPQVAELIGYGILSVNSLAA